MPAIIAMSSTGGTSDEYLSLVASSPATDLIVTISSVDEGATTGYALTGALATRF